MILSTYEVSCIFLKKVWFFFFNDFKHLGAHIRDVHRLPYLTEYVLLFVWRGKHPAKKSLPTGADTANAQELKRSLESLTSRIGIDGQPGNRLTLVHGAAKTNPAQSATAEMQQD